MLAFKNPIEKRWFFAKLGARLLGCNSCGAFRSKCWKKAFVFGLEKEKDVKLAKCTEGDLDQIHAIEVLSFDERFRFDKEYYLELLRNPDVRTIKLSIGSELMGYILWFNKNHEIITINIHQKYRRMGLAKLILQAFEASLEKPVDIILDVYELNTAAINLYKKMRYKYVAYGKDYYGEGINSLKMKKTLRQ
jgi:ribosomal protein S18 acetylase RimI-like enzyme